MLATVSSAVGVVAAVFGVIAGLGGVTAVVLVMGRQNATKLVVSDLDKSVGLFSLANAELRTQVESAARDRNVSLVAFQQQLADERAACASSIGKLQGQVDVLTSGLANAIATSVVGSVASLIETARADLAEKVGAVKADTSTTNGMTLGSLADQAEGRRQSDIPEGDRTRGGQRYVDGVHET